MATTELKINVGKLNNIVIKELFISTKSTANKNVFIQVEDVNKEKYTTVYDKHETKFVSNGLAILDDCYRCEVEEVINGLYNLELEYSILDKKVEYLKEENIIKTITPNGEQPFRIYRVATNLDTITVYGMHIFFDLAANFLIDCRHKFATCQQALDDILNSTLYKHKFTCSSNIDTRSNAYYIRKNPAAAILTEENSIVNMYNAEILRDKYKIVAATNIGKDNHVVIEYSKNILGLEKDGDIYDVVTRVIPTGLTKDDAVIMLDEVYIDSPLIKNYHNPIVKEYHFSDLKEDVEKGITIAMVKDELRKRVKELFSKDHIDLPKINYRINFLDLSCTDEYKKFKKLNKVKLGDIVTVRHKDLGIDIKRKVIHYKFDCLTRQYIEIELGDLQKTLKNDINKLSSKISDVENNMNSTNQLANKAIDKVSDLEEVNFRDLKQTLEKIEKLATGNSSKNKFLEKAIKENTEKINNYKLPIASTNSLGAIKIGSGLSITSDGMLTSSGSGSGVSTNIVPRVTKTPNENEIYIYQSDSAEFTLSTSDSSKISINGNKFINSGKGGSITATVNKSGMLSLNLNKKGTRYYLIKSTINGNYTSSAWLDNVIKYNFEVSKGDTIEFYLEDTATGWEGEFIGLSKNSLIWNSHIGKIELTGTKVDY